MTATIPKVSIVMLAHNGFPLSSSCLKSLKKLTYPNYDVIVVDDASTDDSPQRLKEAFPDVTLIRNKRCMGYCGGFNVGIREALKNKADYIVIAQNDSKDYSVNYLEEVVKAFTGDNKVGLVGSKVFTFEGKIAWGGENHERFGIFMNTPTCGYVIKGEVFEKIGLFDETLFIFFEDLDFIKRLRKAGYKTTFVSTVSYAHRSAGTMARFSFLYNYYRVRNIFWFAKKYSADISLMGKLREIVNSMLTHVIIILRCCKQGKIKDLITVTGAVFKGLIDGIFLPYKGNKKRDK